MNKNNSATKAKLFLIAKIFLVAAILFGICSALYSFRGELASLSNVDWSLMTLAIVFSIVYRVVNAHGWYLSMRAVGQQLPALSALKAWLISEACRWLPGSVWSYGSRVYHAQKLGLEPAPAAASMFLELMVTLASWLFVAVGGLIIYRAAFVQLIQGIPTNIIIGCIVGLVVCGIAIKFFGKPLSNKFFSKLEKLNKQLKSFGAVNLCYPKAIGTFLFYCVMNIFNGVTFYYVLLAVAPDNNVPILAVIGANAASWLIGFFAFMAPGGLVVREGALAAILAIWMPMELALAASVIWRMMQIVVELVCMGGAVVPEFLTFVRRTFGFHTEATT